MRRPSSALGLGCAELYREPSAAQRRRLLEVALDHGITHFDAAPMYGLGIAESELGRFARGRRDQISIATKFGIAPTLAAQGLARVQGPVRRVLAASPALRRRARSEAAGPSSGGAGSLLYRSTGFDTAGARASLERSLKRLRTDYIDLLLLHDPEPATVRYEELAGFLDQARSAGRIRDWGVAGEPAPTLAVARGFPQAPPVLQVRDDLLDRPGAGIEAPASPTRITFGLLGGALASIVAHVTADAEARRRWSDAIGVDCGSREAVASLVLRQAIRENPDGVVLFGTIRADHIAAAGASAGVPAERADELDAFVRLIDAELRPAAAPNTGAAP
jgi:D-threo-aldose 1-dehydrogenase